MLTFFEYLRQRAFESVVAGVQDAYAYLDSHKSFESGKLPPSTSEPKARLDSAPVNADPSAPDSGTTHGGNSNEKLLPPRKRGRPKTHNGEPS